eukprot:Blabericola_migrator_1__3779@NODE_2135_length_3223_cov_30_357731_g1352_i0_p1_GENE_NODE_2135_length_3223_cov_30_357731_g1352_i0NODE_2135_length_3223_cov_30_357731_g1352_i0_p1_ORF_typecomplete_len941_score107_19_NODE_2135_length_3223_cov_30_357731_g1352_i03853207
MRPLFPPAGGGPSMPPPPPPPSRNRCYPPARMTTTNPKFCMPPLKTSVAASRLARQAKQDAPSHRFGNAHSQMSDRAQGGWQPPIPRPSLSSQHPPPKWWHPGVPPTPPIRQPPMCPSSSEVYTDVSLEFPVDAVPFVYHNLRDYQAFISAEVHPASLAQLRFTLPSQWKTASLKAISDMEEQLRPFVIHDPHILKTRRQLKSNINILTSSLVPITWLLTPSASGPSISPPPATHSVQLIAEGWLSCMRRQRDMLPRSLIKAIRFETSPPGWEFVIPAPRSQDPGVPSVPSVQFVPCADCSILALALAHLEACECLDTSIAWNIKESPFARKLLRFHSPHAPMNRRSKTDLNRSRSAQQDAHGPPGKIFAPYPVVPPPRPEASIKPKIESDHHPALTKNVSASDKPLQGSQGPSSERSAPNPEPKVELESSPPIPCSTPSTSAGGTPGDPISSHQDKTPEADLQWSAETPVVEEILLQEEHRLETWRHFCRERVKRTVDLLKDNLTMWSCPLEETDPVELQRYVCVFKDTPVDDDALKAAKLRRVGPTHQLLSVSTSLKNEATTTLEPEPDRAKFNEVSNCIAYLLGDSQVSLKGDKFPPSESQSQGRRETPKRVGPREQPNPVYKNPSRKRRNSATMTSAKTVDFQLRPHWDAFQSSWVVSWNVNGAVKQRLFYAELCDTVDQARKKAEADTYCRSLETAVRAYARLTRDMWHVSFCKEGTVVSSLDPLKSAVAQTLPAQVISQLEQFLQDMKPEAEAPTEKSFRNPVISESEIGPHTYHFQIRRFRTFKEARSYHRVLQMIEAILKNQSSVWQTALGFDLLGGSHLPVRYLAKLNDELPDELLDSVAPSLSDMPTVYQSANVADLPPHTTSILESGEVVLWANHFCDRLCIGHDLTARIKIRRKTEDRSCFSVKGRPPSVSLLLQPTSHNSRKRKTRW